MSEHAIEQLRKAQYGNGPRRQERHQVHKRFDIPFINALKAGLKKERALASSPAKENAVFNAWSHKGKFKLTNKTDKNQRQPLEAKMQPNSYVNNPLSTHIQRGPSLFSLLFTGHKTEGMHMMARLQIREAAKKAVAPVTRTAAIK